MWEHCCLVLLLLEAPIPLRYLAMALIMSVAALEVHIFVTGVSIYAWMKCQQLCL